MMSEETIVAVYDTAAHAQLAISDLKAANVPDGAVSQHSSDGAAGEHASSGTNRQPGFWSQLFGGDSDHDTAVYDRSMQSGSTVVTVKAPANAVSRVMEILESHNPIDIDERGNSYGLAQTGVAAPAATPAMRPATASPRAVADDGTIELAEERLSIGKRLVNRGGTRIRRYVVETPVEEQVTLHDEKVNVERRPVTDGRTVANADFSDKTIEMTESSEEAVVGKTAHVVEEVVVRKQASDRVETVRDKVRREEVEVQKIPGQAAAAGAMQPANQAASPKI